MNKIGIELSVESGGFVSGIASAERAVESLTQAMKQAKDEGRDEDFVRLQIQRDTLAASTSSFKNDTQKLFSDTRLQSTAQSGATVLEMAPDQATAFKDLNTTIKNLTSVYIDQINSKDFHGAQETFSQIQREQGNYRKAVEEATLPYIPQGINRSQQPDYRETTPFPSQRAIPQQPEFAETKRPENILGELVSTSETAKNAIRNLEAQIERAKQTNDPKLGELYYTRDKLKYSSAGLNRDTENLLKSPKFQQITDKQLKGQTLTKSEEQYLSRLDSLNDQLKKNTSALLEASKLGDTDEMLRQTPQIEKGAGELHKAVGDVSPAEGAKGIIATIGAAQITNAITDSMSRIVGSLDRSSVINAYGSGDILGGRIAETRRQASLTGGLLQTLGAIGGGIIGGGIAIATGGVGSAAIPAGIAIGSAILGGAGKIPGMVMEGKANTESTEAAYAGLWQQRSADSMRLAALTGDPKLIREAFKEAADAAAKFGYSAEEGMDAINQAVQQGLKGDKAREITEQVFQYERSTGADRGTLSSLANMSTRYGAGDALKAGWAGLQASGMTPGQYNEYLRAIQRTMEEGISKGLKLPADQIVQNLTMLSQMTGNNPLWQGENGARRLSEMNAGLEGATGLNTASDIIAYRAAQNLVPEGKGDSYIEAMKIMEGGLTPKFFKEYMKMTNEVEGGGYEGIVERMRQTFGLNYTNADKLYQAWKENPYQDWEAVLKKYENKPLPDAKSPELEVAQLTAQTANITVQTGQIKFDESLPKFQEERKKAEEELKNAGYGKQEYTPSDITRLLSKAEGDRKQEYDDALKSGNKDQIDKAFAEWQRATSTRVATMKNADSLFDQVDPLLGKLFSPGILPYGLKSAAQRNDYDARDKIRTTLGNAIYSEDGSQSQAANDFLAMLKSVQENTLKAWDVNNTFNSLAGNDMAQLLTALQKLTDKTDELLQATKENRQINLILEN